MIRIKTLSLPLISALLASATLPAAAKVSLELSSKKTYRQNKSGIYFKGGSFDIQLEDGSITSVGGCNWIRYYPPGIFRGVCSEGTTGFITSGNINGASVALPYLLVSGLAPAIVIEPRFPAFGILNSAPASTLPRPSGGFKDDSISVFYNLHTTSVAEYIITRYNTSRGYTAQQGKKFDSEIVPGTYYYSFPRLGHPEMPAPIKAVIYPMAEGRRERNNKEEGFEFTAINKNEWDSQGFLEMSYLRPNIIKWRGLTAANVIPRVDSLRISLRALQNPKDPQSAAAEAIFPTFVSGQDPRIILRNPYVTSFTTPPIFPSGTRALVQIDLERAFQTGGVTYDFSTRKFQVPIIVVDSYQEYDDITFANSNKSSNLLDDADGDGYNNLNEWILDSNATDASSVPVPPKPELVQDFLDPFFGNLGASYFGFDINKKLETRPGVKYTLQRSKNQGKTWATFRAGFYYRDGTYSQVRDPFKPLNWIVSSVKGVTAGAPRSEIRVRSQVYKAGTGGILLNTDEPIQPPGTAGDVYRVKITLPK